MNLNIAQEGLSALGPLQKEFSFIKEINEFNFENFLRIYRNTDSNYFYNLLSNTIYIDDKLDTKTYYNIKVTKSQPWTTLSYNEYRTMNLWWLIMEVNGIRNPLDYPVPGTILKILYPQYVKVVMDSIYFKIRSS
jgi:hypothetical protein